VATYRDAIEWIAANDGAGDTPEGMEWEPAFAVVDGQVTVCLVADVFNKDQAAVASEVLRARGFRKPRER
jgi:hypothetical protein